MTNEIKHAFFIKPIRVVSDVVSYIVADTEGFTNVQLNLNQTRLVFHFKGLQYSVPIENVVFSREIPPNQPSSSPSKSRKVRNQVPKVRSQKGTP